MAPNLISDIEGRRHGCVHLSANFLAPSIRMEIVHLEEKYTKTGKLSIIPKYAKQSDF